MLIKSVLASILKYYLSILTIPMLVTNMIEAWFINFIWNDLDNYYMFHLVNWKLVCHPLVSGGFDIRRIKSSKPSSVGEMAL